MLGWCGVSGRDEEVLARAAARRCGAEEMERMKEAPAGDAWLLPIQLVCTDEEEGRRRIGDSFFNISILYTTRTM
jgi:hypothetical protein